MLEKLESVESIRVDQLGEPAASLRMQAGPPEFPVTTSPDVGGDFGGPTVQVSIVVGEPNMLIGEKGQTLFELQHILKLMLRKKISEPFYLALDINEYKKNKEEYLRDLAQTTADEVVLLKKPKELPPMSSSERRVIHMALASRTDVASESLGDGLDRRVVIKLSST